MLAHGQGRSYGDSCLNDGGKLLRTAGLDRFISFDRAAGLGLTGLITWAEIALRPIPVAAVRAEAIPFAGIDEFVSLSDQGDAEFEYTVAWLDVDSRSQRGIFFRGNHAEGAIRAPALRATVP